MTINKFCTIICENEEIMYITCGNHLAVNDIHDLNKAVKSHVKWIQGRKKITCEDKRIAHNRLWKYAAGLSRLQRSRLLFSSFEHMFIHVLGHNDKTYRCLRISCHCLRDEQMNAGQKKKNQTGFAKWQRLIRARFFAAIHHSTAARHISPALLLMSRRLRSPACC